MPQKLVDRMASASLVYGFVGAATFSATSGNPMSGNIVIIFALTVFGIMYTMGGVGTQSLKTTVRGGAHVP